MTTSQEEMYGDEIREDEILDGDEKPSMKLEVPASATIVQRKMLLSYIGGAKQLKAEQNNIIEVKGVVWHKDYIRDRDGNIKIDEQTGELKIGYRTILLLTDGSKRTATSPVLYRYVKDSLVPLLGIDGQMGHFIESVKLKILMTPTKSGGQTYDVTLIED
jgi:hypothetical protein